MATKTSSEEMRGGVLGIYQSSINLAIIIATAISGSIYAINPTAPFWMGAGLSLLVLIPAGFLVRGKAAIPGLPGRNP